MDLFSVKCNILGTVVLSWAIYFNSTARARGASAVCEESAHLLSKLSKGLDLFRRLLLTYLSPVEMSAVFQHPAGLARMSKEEQASPASSCCLSPVPLVELKLPLATAKGFVLLNVGQETQASDIRITVSVCKVSVNIKPFLVGFILPSKSKPSWAVDL